MRKPTDESELDNLNKLINAHPLGAFLAACTYLEKIINDFAENVGLDKELRRRPYWMLISHRLLERYGIELPEDIRKEMDEIRRLRNTVSHGQKDPTKSEVKEAIKVIERIKTYFGSLNYDEVRQTVNKAISENQKEAGETSYNSE
ncbi:MAG: DUF4145 domain-containing protein [Thermotogota bacterium]|nr:DUF4145 domain-containing protein [Thermotogota bacterium]